MKVAVPLILIVIATTLMTTLVQWWRRTRPSAIRNVVLAYYMIVIADFCIAALFDDGFGVLAFPLAILAFPWNWIVGSATSHWYPRWYYYGQLETFVHSIGIGASLNAWIVIALSRFTREPNEGHRQAMP